LERQNGKDGLFVVIACPILWLGQETMDRADHHITTVQCNWIYIYFRCILRLAIVAAVLRNEGCNQWKHILEPHLISVLILIADEQLEIVFWFTAGGTVEWNLVLLD